MKARKIYREYAKSQGKEAKEFVRIDQFWYNQDTLITKDSNGDEERTEINYKNFAHWIIKNFKNL